MAWMVTAFPEHVMGRAPAVLLAGALVAVVALNSPASAKDRPANSKLEPRVSDPNDHSSFHFVFRSLTDRAGPNLYVYMYVLRVDGASRRVVMLLNRNGADRPGLPAGLFATTLSKEQATALREAVEGIKWNELPELRGGDISAAALSLDYSRGSRIIQRSFNAYNVRIPERHLDGHVAGDRPRHHADRPPDEGDSRGARQICIGLQVDPEECWQRAGGHRRSPAARQGSRDDPRNGGRGSR